MEVNSSDAYLLGGVQVQVTEAALLGCLLRLGGAGIIVLGTDTVRELPGVVP